VPTRRRNPAPLVDALTSAHTLLAEAARLLDEAAEKIGTVGAAISREKRRDVVAYANLADAARICDAALSARTLARGGAAAAKKAKQSLIEAYELWEEE